MTFVAKRLIAEVQKRRPDIYEAILQKISPYSLDSVLKIFECHLKNVPDLSVFNKNVDAIPEFMLTVVRYMKLPIPGDAIGIMKICRANKSDTQGALDSKHRTNINSEQFEFNVEKEILDELALFSNHMQIFELANRHKYATVFMSPDTSLRNLMQRLPKACILERGGDFNKGRNAEGVFRYLITFKYILVEDRGSLKVLYRSLADLYLILRCVPLKHVVCFSDIRCLFKKCGNTCSFFNMLEIANRQLFMNDGSKYEKDVITLLTFMFRRAELLPMNREGLAKNKDRTPIDVFSFEAMKKNGAKFCTGPSRGEWHTVERTLEQIFYGQQPNSGTGFTFECRPHPKFFCMPPNRE